MSESPEAARSVLSESLQVLGHVKNGLVIVGGWVPDLLFPGKGHMGSMDVDYAVDSREIPDYVYETIKKRLLEAGYVQPDARNSFIRVVGNEQIKVDLIAGVTSGPPVPIQGMILSQLKGIEIALDHYVEIDIHGEMPNGAKNCTRAKVAKPEALILMKGIALDERQKSKDAYDIYFCLQHYEGGPAALAHAVNGIPRTQTCEDSLRILASKFKDEQHIGPKWAAEFVAENGGDAEFTVTDAVERMRVFLKNLS